LSPRPPGWRAGRGSVSHLTPTQDVTVMGRPDIGLLVVADFDTPAARAVGLITAHRRHGRPSTAWSGTPRT
jgi:hypothetical protein